MLLICHDLEDRPKREMMEMQMDKTDEWSRIVKISSSVKPIKRTVYKNLS